jgi:carboxypeptidase Q
MRARLAGFAVVIALGTGAGRAPAQGQEADPNLDRIVGQALARGGAQAFLQELTDTIGGRVTGSPESKAAAELLLRALREAGFDGAHLEEYTLASRWERGQAAARVASPGAQRLTVGSYGWAPGTAGEVTGPLVDLGSPEGHELPLPARELRGALVLVEPHALPDAPSQVMRAALARKLAEAGAAAMLIPSGKPHRMVFTSAFAFYPGAPLPVLSVAREDVLYLRRLLARGPVRLAVDVANTLDSRPSTERNVVAEIEGTTSEVVLLGAHLDSWDPGQGAQDDGAGVAAVLEAARILKALGLKPRRTLRFVFFSGEEQALLGSRAYVEAHRAELDGLRAAVIMDSGAETPRGFRVHGRDDVAPAARVVLEPLAPLGASGVSLEASFDMDHGPFLHAGVPVYTLWVDDGEYDVHHHAISDTFDKVDPAKLALDTAVMAVAAYRLATVPEAPGQRLTAAQSAQLLEKLGLESLRRVLYEGTPP